MSFARGTDTNHLLVLVKYFIH